MNRLPESEHDAPADAGYVLVIDLGTGGPKSAVVSQTGDVVASAYERIEVQMLPGGAPEQDPE